MVQYIRRPSDDQGSSKDIVPQATIDTNSTNASSMHSSIEKIEPEEEEIDGETHEIAVDKFETEVDVENDSCHGTVNVTMNKVNKKFGIICLMLLSGIYQFQIIFGLKLSKEEAVYLRIRMTLSML